jgi:hypothetical protein
MRVIALLAPILAALGVISSLQAEEKEIIKDKSPDKKFALRMTHGEQLGMRARSTWYHLIDVREERLPVYEQAKSGEPKPSQP